MRSGFQRGTDLSVKTLSQFRIDVKVQIGIDDAVEGRVNIKEEARQKLSQWLK